MTNNSEQVCKLLSYFMSEGEEANKECQSRFTEFRTDKPYRLALYVHPSTKRNINVKNLAILANVSEIRRNQNKENASKVKRTKKNESCKSVSIGLFDDNPREQKKEKNRLADVEGTTVEEPPKKVLKQSILHHININKNCHKPASEVDTASLSKSKQKKMRKSYVKKCKEYHSDSEKIVEPSSEEILKEIDIKKIAKNKPKKNDKEEEEFEKWAENVNSAFDEIDKFELSVNYD